MLSGGSTDAFVTTLDASGSALLYSSYLGSDGVNPPRSLPIRSAICSSPDRRGHRFQ
jgi:hypothetical protein